MGCEQRGGKRTSCTDCGKLGVISAYSVANSFVDAGGWARAAIAFSTVTVAASVVPLAIGLAIAIGVATGVL